MTSWNLAIFNYSTIDGKLLEQKKIDFGKEWDGGIDYERHKKLANLLIED